MRLYMNFVMVWLCFLAIDLRIAFLWSSYTESPADYLFCLGSQYYLGFNNRKNDNYFYLTELDNFSANYNLRIEA